MNVEKSCLDKLVDILKEISYNNMPEDVVKKSKECLADFIGIFVNGSQKEKAIQLRVALNDKNQNDPESIAFWMGSTARMLDIDDGHRFAMAHPGVVVCSTAIAMALALNEVRGAKVVEAIVKGYEVYCFQGRVINPSAYLIRGVDSTSICGAAASATVAGTMMGLSYKQIANAISLAASIAGGLNQSAVDGSEQKFLVAGYGAKLGISVANLAKYGMGGPRRVFEGKFGFCNAFSPEPDLDYLYNPKLVWDIRNVYIKMYACVRRIHATLDALTDIIESKKITKNDIKNINVYGSQFLHNAGGYDPIDMAQAQTSVPYAVAILLKYGRVDDQLVHDNILNAEIYEYSKKVKVIKDAEIIALAEKDKSLWGAARVEVILNNGTIYEGTQIMPYGDPEKPLPENAVKDKFIKLVEGVVGIEAAATMWQDINSLENLNDAGAFFESILKQIR
jgi:2-methylcitrate dehydratase PrpD